MARRSAPQASRLVSQAVSPPNRSLSTTDRLLAGRAVRSGQSLAGTDPIQCSPVPARCVKFAAEFCPASNTTVISAPSAAIPAASQTAAYCAFSWSIMPGNWVTSGLSPG